MEWLTNLSTETYDPISDLCDQIARGTAFISSSTGGDENGSMSAGGSTEGGAREYLSSEESAQQAEDEFASFCSWGISYDSTPSSVCLVTDASSSGPVEQLQRRLKTLRKEGSKKRSLETEKPNQADFDPIDGRDFEAAPSYPTSLEATTQSSSMASDLLPRDTDPSSSPGLSSSSEPPPPSSSLASCWTVYDIQPSSSPSAVSAFTATPLSPATSSSASLSSPIHSAPSRTRSQADRPPTSSSPSPGTSVTALSSAKLDPPAAFSSTFVASSAPSPSASNAVPLTSSPLNPSFRHLQGSKKQSQSDQFKPYPFLWKDDEVRPKLRRLAQLLRRDPDDDETLEEAA
ncbi:hypothetical protein JCM8097_008373 [Rhodosporidiobolus ruineniae]